MKKMVKKQLLPSIPPTLIFYLRYLLLYVYRWHGVPAVCTISTSLYLGMCNIASDRAFALRKVSSSTRIIEQVSKVIIEVVKQVFKDFWLAVLNQFD